MSTVALKLGRSDVVVSGIGIGAMTWGDGRAVGFWNPSKSAYGMSDGVDAERRALQASLAAGVSFIDTAEMYGGGASEARVGELAPGKDFVVATKFPPSPFHRAQSLPAALQASLRRLRREVLDLYQIHFPFAWLNVPKALELMGDAVAAGKIRAVGVSNFSAEQMCRAHEALARRGVPLASNQVEYSLLHRQPEADGVLQACRELNVTLIAYSPLAMGALTGKYAKGSPPAKGFRRFTPNFRKPGLQALAPVVKLLKDIGAGHSRTPAQVALRWLVQARGALPIPGAKNERQALENAGALSFSLTAAEVEALDRATSAWRGRGA